MTSLFTTTMISPRGPRPSEERLALARALFPALNKVAEARITVIRPPPGTFAHHVVPPYRTRAEWVAQAIEDARHRVSPALWGGKSVVTFDEDVVAQPQIATHELDAVPSHPDAPRVAMYVVNTVQDTVLTGSGGDVGTIARRPVLPIAALHQVMFGLACPYRTNRNRSFRLRYANKFCATHSVFPTDMRIKETAAMNDALGELALQTTLALVAIGLDLQPLGTLAVLRRKCCNRVFATYMPKPIYAEVLLDRYATVFEHEGHYDVRGTVGRLPVLTKRQKLLVFRTPLVYVGASDVRVMKYGMQLFLPYVFEAMGPEAALAAAEIRRRRPGLLGPPPTTQKRRREDQVGGSAKKRPRLGRRKKT